MTQSGLPIQTTKFGRVAPTARWLARPWISSHARQACRAYVRSTVAFRANLVIDYRVNVVQNVEGWRLRQEQSCLVWNRTVTMCYPYGHQPLQTSELSFAAGAARQVFWSDGRAIEVHGSHDARVEAASRSNIYKKRYCLGSSYSLYIYFFLLLVFYVIAATEINRQKKVTVSQRGDIRTDRRVDIKVSLIGSRFTLRELKAKPEVSYHYHYHLSLLLGIDLLQMYTSYHFYSWHD